MITEKRKEKRKHYLGASDVAAVLGLDPFRNAYDIWLEKTGRLQDKVENKAMQRGIYLEEAVLNWFADSQQKKIVRNQIRALADSPVPIVSSLDALVPDEKRPVEAKTAGPYSKEVWGDEGTDQVPDRVLVQTTVQMLCTQAELCYVPTYLPYREFVLFLVPFNKQLGDYILKAAERFWQKNVIADTPPEQCAPSVELAKCIRRQPNRIVSIPPTVSRLYRQTAAALKEKEQEYERAKALLLAALDGAEEGICEEDGTVYTNKEYERETLDTKRLKKENPQIASQFLKKTTYTMLKVKEERKT